MKDNFAIIKVFNDNSINFNGNTAAVVFVENPIGKEKMQNLAADFNQPATSFIWPLKKNNEFGVAWFAPDAQIDICGHGSMAQAAWVGETLGIREMRLIADEAKIHAAFNQKGKAEISLKPILTKEKLSIPKALENALGIDVLEYYSTNNKYLVVLQNEEAVRNMEIDFDALRKLEPFGYTVTAKGNKVDFVSRTLVPKVQQLEDHATGSSHAALTPFWANRLHKSEMIAHQLSKRGGKFICALDGSSVKLSGNYEILVRGNCSI